MKQKILPLTLEPGLDSFKGCLKSSALVLCANNALPGGCVREQRHTGVKERLREAGGGREDTCTKGVEAGVYLRHGCLGERGKKILIVNTFYEVRQ